MIIQHNILNPIDLFAWSIKMWIVHLLDPCFTLSYYLTTLLCMNYVHKIKPNTGQNFKTLKLITNHWSEVLNLERYQSSIIALEIPRAVSGVCFWWEAQLGADQVKIVCCANQLCYLCFPDAVLFATLARYLELTKSSCSKSAQLQISE